MSLSSETKTSNPLDQKISDKELDKEFKKWKKIMEENKRTEYEKEETNKRKRQKPIESESKKVEPIKKSEKLLLEEQEKYIEFINRERTYSTSYDVSKYINED